MGKDEFTPTEREIYDAIRDLHREGKPTSNAEIGKRVFKSKWTVKTHKTAIFRKLGITGTDKVKMNKLLKGMDEPENPMAETTEKPSATRRIWIVLIALIAAGAISYRVFRPQGATATPTPTIVATNTVQPSGTGTEGQGGIILTDTLPSPTFTVVPPTPTSTFTPTLTSLPTETFTPEPTVTSNEIVLFEDNFDSNYLDPNIWVPHIGKIYAFNGMMTTDDGEAEVVIRDGTWKNLKVSFDIVEMLCYGNDINPFVGLRVDDSFNYFALVYSNCRIGWNTVAMVATTGFREPTKVEITTSKGW